MADGSIATYMQRLQRILGDPVFERFNPFDLLDYINEARGIVASEGECIRVLCPSTAGVSSATITNPGTAYTTAPLVTISAPFPFGKTAQAFASLVGTSLAAITISDPGYGYTASPTISITGGGGHSATSTAILLPSVQCIAGQETYNFSDLNTILQTATISPSSSTPVGAASILAIRNISVSWGGTKPTLRYFEWGDFQAYLRARNLSTQGLPACWSQYGRGTTGSFYLWPVPSQNAQMDLDCICLPQDLDLQSNINIEPIPYPWTNAVPYKAAEIAVLGDPALRDLSEKYAAHYRRRMEFATAASHPALVPDPYKSAARL